MLEQREAAATTAAPWSNVKTTAPQQSMREILEEEQRLKREKSVQQPQVCVFTCCLETQNVVMIEN